MTRILAIDPGNTDSGYAIIDADRRPLHFGKVANHTLLDMLGRFADEQPLTRVAIEMVASYGMPVGADVFETCVWIGRYQQVLVSTGPGQGTPVELVKRHPVKVHHCHSAKATDANVAQALKDRFAPGVRNHGKGTKADPGWFYGFKADVWQAYALAVYIADTAPQSAPVVTSTPTAGAPASGTPDQQGEGSDGAPDPTPSSSAQEVLFP